MRSRSLLLPTVLSIVAALPFTALAANTSFFGPIIPQSGSCVCDGKAMDWGCVLQVFQNILDLGTSLSVIFIVLVIAWGGFTLIISGGNPKARTEAKNRLLNAVLGLVLVLGSFILVDTIMKVLYNPDTAFNGQTFGPWNTILAGGESNYCVKVNEHPGLLTNGSLGTTVSNLFNSGTSNSSSVSIPANAAGSACDPAALQQANPGLSTKEANTLACLAKPESTCGQHTTGAASSAGKASSAAGPFQILLGSKDKCHSLTLPQCGNLNCSAAYSGGKPKSDSASQQLANQCQAAVNNLSCSTAAADCLIKQGGGKYTAWTGTGDGYTHSAQSQCVATYSGT